MVSEPSTGYICGFELYTGDASGQLQGNAQELQDASKNFLHCPRFARFSTGFGHGSSCHKRKTHACGTVRKNQKLLHLAVTQAKLKQGETVFCHKNNLLALKWMDKREVYILSSLHKVTNVISKNTNYKE